MVITADKRGISDGAAHSMCQKIDSKLPVIIVSWVEGFIFNDKLLDLTDYCLVCFCEYGWDFEITDSHIWGVNSEKFSRYYNNDWIKFDNWVKEKPPKILFKRELLKKDVSGTIKPIEYPCVVNSYPVQSETEFNSRPINVFQYWGRSNECRLRIHGEIWLHAFQKGFQPCDNIYYVNNYLNNEAGEKWVTLWIPHWARVDVNELLKINNHSKLSLSWPGAGFKCFRNSEAPVNSVMVMHRNSFSWAYDWDESNCILVEPGEEISGIEASLNRNDLYEVYKAGVETCNKYKTDNYIRNYLKPLIDAI